MQIIIFIGFSVLPFQITDRFGISKYIANLKHRVRKRIGCGYTRGEDTAGEGNSGSSSRRRPLAPQRGYEELVESEEADQCDYGIIGNIRCV